LDRGSTNTESSRQLSVTGKWLTAPDEPEPDLAANLLGNVFVGPELVDRAEVGVPSARRRAHLIRAIVDNVVCR